MARIITDTYAARNTLGKQLSYHLYNGLDCCVTAEVLDTLKPQLNELTQGVYDFERSMQAVSLTMQLRGINVDDQERQENIKLLKREAKVKQKVCEAFAIAKRGHGFKWGIGMPPPNLQMQKLLWESCKIPKQYNKQDKVSTDKEILTRLIKKYPGEVGDFLTVVLQLRDWGKQLEVFTKGLSPDGRFRSSFNVGATETGRWTSTGSPFGDGGNLFNIDRRLRGMFIPDPGYTMLNADLEQAESRHVAYKAGDEAYIAAHEAGNVHVEAAKVFWPDFGWSGDARENKARLKGTPVPWIRQDPPKGGEDATFGYYDMSKRAQHGLNYGLKYGGLATWLGCKQKEAKGYIAAYFGKYPCLPVYHHWIEDRIKTFQRTTTCVGRPRQFLGRYWENATIREAIAHDSQSAIADILNIALKRIWDELDPHLFQVLSQNYDSILGQFKPERDEHDFRDTIDEDILKQWVAKLMLVPTEVIDIRGKARIMTIPAEVATGPNWRDCA